MLKNDWGLFDCPTNHQLTCCQRGVWAAPVTYCTLQRIKLQYTTCHSFCYKAVTQECVFVPHMDATIKQY